MKKRPSRLTLSRETLQNLATPASRRAVGAGNTYEFVSGCDCTDGCETTGITCPTFSCFTECGQTCWDTCAGC
ncbi:MAG TPA: hypothetical protein VN783_07055 [Thermoanaerobaculia bacterium]|nr:hypothetical protein [Thermoanaerobaculia bacterium]